MGGAFQAALGLRHLGSGGRAQFDWILLEIEGPLWVCTWKVGTHLDISTRSGVNVWGTEAEGLRGGVSRA